MKIKELSDLLKTLDIPLIYGAYEEKDHMPKVPYIAIIEKRPSRELADNKVFHYKNHWDLELYTSKKDFELENKIISLLDKNKIIWSKSEDLQIDKDFQEVIFEI